MSDDNEDIDSSEGESKTVPWIDGLQVFARYGKNLAQIQKLIARKKLRVKRINGKDAYSVEDLDNLMDGDLGVSPEASMADLVRAGRDMLAQVQSHHAQMFDKYMKAFAEVLSTQSNQIEKQNSHIINLEKQALDMREATEKVFNLEHTRKMEELKEERIKGMQAKALEMLQKTVAPWIAQKMGAAGVSGATPPEASGAIDPRFAMLGQEVVTMVCTMTDDAFEAMKPLIGEERWEILNSIRQSSKEGS